MKLPIVITEDWDISIHPTPLHAESFLEIVDIKDGIYVGYDRNGNLLDLCVDFVEKLHKFLFLRWSSRSEMIRINLHQPLENRQDELRMKLIYYLVKIGEKDNLNELSTDELIQKVANRMPWGLDTKKCE